MRNSIYCQVEFSIVGSCVHLRRQWDAIRIRRSQITNNWCRYVIPATQRLSLHLLQRASVIYIQSPSVSWLLLSRYFILLHANRAELVRTQACRHPRPMYNLRRLCPCKTQRRRISRTSSDNDPSSLRVGPTVRICLGTPLTRPPYYRPVLPRQPRCIMAGLWPRRRTSLGPTASLFEGYVFTI